MAALRCNDDKDTGLTQFGYFFKQCAILRWQPTKPKCLQYQNTVMTKPCNVEQRRIKARCDLEK